MSGFGPLKRHGQPLGPELLDRPKSGGAPETGGSLQQGRPGASNLLLRHALLATSTLVPVTPRQKGTSCSLVLAGSLQVGAPAAKAWSHLEDS